MKERLRNKVGAIKDGLRMASWYLAEAGASMSTYPLTPGQRMDLLRGKQEAQAEVAANRVARRRRTRLSERQIRRLTDGFFSDPQISQVGSVSPHCQDSKSADFRLNFSSFPK